MSRVTMVVFNGRSQAFYGLDALTLLRPRACDCRQESEDKEEPFGRHECRSAQSMCNGESHAANYNDRQV